MFDRVVLHIGHPKTGSTSIQWTLNKSRAVLRDAGIHYPKPIFGRNHRELIPHFFGPGVLKPRDDKKIAYLGGDTQRVSEETWQSIEKAADDPGLHTLVLSCESFFKVLTHQQVERLAALLGSVAGKIDVVAYIREPASAYLSGVQQRVKHRADVPEISVRPVRQVLEPFLDHPAFDLHVRSFDRQSLIDGDVVTDFLTHYLADTLKLSLKHSEGEMNTSISPEAMALMLDFNQGRWHPGPRYAIRTSRVLRPIMSRVDKAVPGWTKPKLKPEIAGAISGIAQEFQWLAETFDVSFPLGDGGSIDNVPAAPPAVSKVSDVCVVDEARLKQLKSRLRRATWLSQLDRQQRLRQKRNQRMMRAIAD